MLNKNLNIPLTLSKLIIHYNELLCQTKNIVVIFSTLFDRQQQSHLNLSLGATFVLPSHLSELKIRYIFVNGVSGIIFDTLRIEPEYKSRKTNKRDMHNLIKNNYI